MATASVTNQFTASTTIVSDDVDTNFGDLVTFLNASVLHLDGAKAMSGDLDMGAQDINNVPWKAWTPTYVNLTLGNGSVVARYIQIGDLVVARFRLVFGSTTTIDGSDPRFSAPVTAETSYTSADHIGAADLLDSGTAHTIGTVRFIFDTHFNVLAHKSDVVYATYAPLSATVPFTWTTSDEILFHAVYEAA